MNDNDYLKKVLEGQDLADDSAELRTLRSRRDEVETVLRERFKDSNPSIKYGGSKAKGTLIREAYDLDLACYFEHEDTKPGQSLEDIFNNTKAALEAKYRVEPKTSALRIRGKDWVDFHVDVVPGRFTGAERKDCFLHQTTGDKARLKTNLKVHIDYVRDSGLLDPIRLLKLWKARKALTVKQFAYELEIIALLSKKKGVPLTDQLIHVWTQLRDRSEPVPIEDPANPVGNDLMPLLRTSWAELSSVARSTLTVLEASGWEGVFGPLNGGSGGDKAARLTSAATGVANPTKPWLSRGDV